MATIAFSLAGQVVGGFLGGPIGATVGRALGALAGARIDNALFGNDRPQPAPHADLRLQGSLEGGPIPRLYGWSRLTGNIIWATALEELSDETAGAKGLFKKADDDDSEPAYAASFALALCEGEVHRLGRIWADGKLLDTEGLTLRFYAGREDQGVDSLIEAKQGTSSAPAYRGLCYIVFERLPIGPFGNRIPQLSVEVCRVVGELEPAIRAVTIIPGATEFGYDPVPRVRLVSAGVTTNENTHQSQTLSDWTLSLDELTALCPNLTNVSLVVAWFGDDLRAGHCTIAPRVEAAVREVEGAAWSVAGLTRDTAQVVSTYDGGPAYGGTPSDAAVLAAIADLKARGLNVTLYPIVLMDIAHGNAMGQPPYPWRGRITGAAADVAGFAAGYRDFVLHYAGLAESAGADALIIGSELRGLTTITDGTGFPFVAALATLAADVRAIVGPDTKLTYAADWSEFAGVQADGDKRFHLDPLWACDDIDAVGIDNYMPVSDWRDGTDHPDAAVADGPYDLAYLRSGIAGGEGYDWYYASDADRVAGTRSPITDGAYDEPWIWRFKDIRNWWSNAHHERIGGVRQASPTAWVPESKPVWFTELGCAAIDKGPNQPNLFGDAKSSEDGRPYFSSGGPDPVAQRQFLRAHLGYWGDADNNPVGMVDLDRIYLWTWDARPYPAFPADTETWRDGVNHAAGHWLTGRLGSAASDEMARAIAGEHGIALDRVDPALPLVHGFALEGVVAAREALEPLCEATGLTVRDGPDGLSLVLPQPRLAEMLDPDTLVAGDGPLQSVRWADPSAAVGQLAMTYPDRERGYLTGTVTAASFAGDAAANRATPLVLDASGARIAAEQVLIREGSDTLEVRLPPSAAALEAGDTVALSKALYVVTDVRDGEGRKITARSLSDAVAVTVQSDRPTALADVPAARAVPIIALPQLPPEPVNPTQSRLVATAWSSPWPGSVSITDEVSGAVLATVRRPAWLGELVDPLHGDADFCTWDRDGSVVIRLHAGHLSSASEEAVLAGTNRITVETDAGDWEVIAFAEATLESPGVYRLATLLRGQQGTDFAIGAAAAGNRVVVLDSRGVAVPVPNQWLGDTLALRSFAGSRDETGTPLEVTISNRPVLPLAPVHLAATRDLTSGDVTLSWTRRSHADGDGWGVDDAPLEYVPEAYLVTILDGTTAVRELAVGAPLVTYTAGEQAADFGALPSTFGFTVAQVSAVHGPGHAATGNFA